MDMPANPWSSVRTRQHAQDFPGRRRPRMKEPASGKQSQLDDEQKHARLARAEDPRRVTWRQPNCMFFEAPSQTVAERCRFVLLLKSLRKK